jgi:hypothetical protein
MNDLKALGWELHATNNKNLYEFHKIEEDDVGSIVRIISLHNGAMKLYTGCMFGKINGWITFEEIEAVNAFIKSLETEQ